MAVELNSAASLGINTGAPDFRVVLEKITAAEMGRLEPNQNLQAQYKISFDSWQETKGLLEEVRLAAEPLTDRVTFNSKVAISSDPDIVTATADITAIPGQYPIVVDKIALFHQVGSQQFASPDTIIGQGDFFIGLKDERPLKITIDSTNHTLQGLMDAINNAKIDVSATINKVDDSDYPYQLVLSSKQSGSDGKISVRDTLSGGEAPLFQYRYTQPSRWYYAPRDGDDGFGNSVGGSSSAVPVISGEYTGEEDITINFKALSDGRVGDDGNVNLAWEDDQGRSGLLKLGEFDYEPGTPIELVDGIMIAFYDGELVQNDTFSLKASPPKDPFFGPPQPATIFNPSTWSNQTTPSGAPMVEGTYTADDDDTYRITVKNGGVIGVTEDLLVEYSSANGMAGVLDFGLGYEPGTKLSIGNGLTLSMQKGALQTGFESEFKVEPSISSDYWWLFGDGDTDGKPALFSEPLNWDGELTSNLSEDDLYDPRSRKSNAQKSIVGEYNLDQDKKYTFTAQGDGRVGINAGLYINWEDGLGNSGVLDVGSDYTAGDELEIEGGLSLKLESGYIFSGDYFYAEAFSPTIQPPQDAEIRVNVSDARTGGRKYVSSTNEIKNAIQGVTLQLHRAEEKVVTITIDEDRQKLIDAIKAFVEAYNKALIYIKEALKYDPETKIAGPLQADRTLISIQNELREILVDAIPGLPTDANTLPFAGISIDRDAMIVFDEQQLDERLASDYLKVANIFRSYGNSDNSGIIYANSRAETLPSGEIGYDIDITQTASQGMFRSDLVPGPFTVLPEENKFFVEIDGRQSNPIALEEGAWSLKQVAKAIKRSIEKDSKLGNVGFDLSVEENRLILKSEKYGNRSSAKISAIDGAQLPFATGTTTNGENVAGTIDNRPASGSGRLLVGDEGGPASGLQLIVTLSDVQTNQSTPEANVVFTKGKGPIVKDYLDEQLNKNSGPVDTSIKNFSDRIDNLESRLASQTERIERRRESLVRQFSRAEARISDLRAQQAQIANQGL